MAERNPSRPWSEAEDILLTNAVRIHGEQDNWKNVATLVPGRTNKACRKRWLHSLTPTVKKSAWTSAEDELLVSLYKTHGSKWSAIARHIPGRTDDACSKRYREALDPSLKKDEWTPAEDARLFELFAQIGGKWGQVGQELQRSGLACRNRHRLLSKRATKVFYDPVPNEPMDETPEMHPDASSEPNDFTTWAPSYPYYPPEAYPSHPDGEAPVLHVSFRSPTPELPIITPDVAPFQFSSSSLCAALSLIPVTSEASPAPHGDLNIGGSSTSGDSNENGLEQGSQDDFTNTFLHNSDLSQIFSGVHFDDNGVFQFPEADGMASGVEWSPFASGIVSSPASAPGQLGLDSRPSSLRADTEPRVRSFYKTFTTLEGSKTEKTYRTRKTTSTFLLPDIDFGVGSVHLASMLRILRYDRMHVVQHNVGPQEHFPALRVSKLLKSCLIIAGLFMQVIPEVWKKNLSGAHWQAVERLGRSTAHFRTALSTYTQKQGANSVPEASSAPQSESEADSGDEDNTRLHMCRHPQCNKGHSQEMPAQLSMVPPALARALPNRTRKTRRKDTS
ncbi:hypothetical protein H0H92_003885 [Tricholoma furcatifolium]|nr:hypothetical protein H0H92_003885 [Tricholoma furcatifolium]